MVSLNFKFQFNFQAMGEQVRLVQEAEMEVQVETSEKHQQILTLRLSSIVPYYFCDQDLI